MGELKAPEGPMTEFTSSYSWKPLDEAVFRTFDAWEQEGRLGFLDLPGDRDLLSELQLEASRGRDEAGTMIAAGIGGSSLGLRALMSALGNGSDRRVAVADSPDSSILTDIIDSCDPASTLLTVITKSGGTAETLAIFMRLYDWLSAALGEEAHSRITAVTDPAKGDLRRLASEKGWRSLPVPPAVGGRFSVLSPVGLYPAAFAGIDVEALLRGAERVLNDLRSRREASLAASIAGAYLSNFRTAPVHVFFPYSDRLYDSALWFAQLWAESLGKRKGLDGSDVFTGQTPIACRGPADQHSLVQLFMEGPKDKTVTIVTIASDGMDSERLPGGFDEYPSFSYLQGRTPDELRAAEAEATAEALEERGLPVSRLILPDLSPESLGELLFALEAATVLVGLALGIDPLDQPGVERGKILTYKAMGRPGY